MYSLRDQRASGTFARRVALEIATGGDEERVGNLSNREETSFGTRPRSQSANSVSTKKIPCSRSTSSCLSAQLENAGRAE